MQLARSDGEIQIIDSDTFETVEHWKVSKGDFVSGEHCRDYGTKGVKVNGKYYRELCWEIVNDNIEVYGVPIIGPAVPFETIPAGNLPFSVRTIDPHQFVVR